MSFDYEIPHNLLSAILVHCNGLLYRVVSYTVYTDEGFRTPTFCRHKFIVSETLKEKARLLSYRIPLIEPPLQWRPGTTGGYHSGTDKLITKSYAIQNQRSLDAINKANSVAYVHRADLRKEKIGYYNKFIKAGDSQEVAVRKANALTLSAKFSYDLVGDRKIWFSHFFDERGRMYCRGYDINLQGTEAKKEALKAVDFGDCYKNK